MPGVSNSSPLIYLSALADLALLRQIVGRVAIPEAVYREVVVDGQGRPGAAEVERLIGDWISVVNIDDASEASNIGHATGLQAGECEAIVLARQLSFSVILMDDQQAVLEACITRPDSCSYAGSVPRRKASWACSGYQAEA